MVIGEQLTIDQVLRIAVDPCERKHKGNPQSVAAHEKVVSTKQETYKKLMAIIKARGPYGATSKELAAAIGKPLHCVSGRLSETKAMGWIKENGERRNGAAVLILAGVER